MHGETLAVNDYTIHSNCAEGATVVTFVTSTSQLARSALAARCLQVSEEGAKMLGLQLVATNAPSDFVIASLAWGRAVVGHLEQLVGERAHSQSTVVPESAIAGSTGAITNGNVHAVGNGGPVGETKAMPFVATHVLAVHVLNVFHVTEVEGGKEIWRKASDRLEQPAARLACLRSEQVGAMTVERQVARLLCNGREALLRVCDKTALVVGPVVVEMRCHILVTHVLNVQAEGGVEDGWPLRLAWVGGELLVLLRDGKRAQDDDTNNNAAHGDRLLYQMTRR